MSYRPVALEEEGSNCFSTYHPTSLSEKVMIKLGNASERNIYLEKKTKENPANFATR